MTEECTVGMPRFGGKKGACFTLREQGRKGSWVENFPKIVALRPHWNYSWGNEIADGYSPAASIEFVPMIWGCNQTFQARVQAVEELGPRMLLAFNEPDKAKQANIAVDKAIEVWPSLEALNIPLVSPGCAQQDGPWMGAFMKQVAERGLRVDAVAVHWYSGPNIKNFQNYLTKTYKLYGRPLVVTEFAIADWKSKSADACKFKPEKVLQFMEQALPWMEQQDWIIGYSWFSFGIDNKCGTCSALFDQDGQLTTLGRFYAEFGANQGVEPVT